MGVSKRAALEYLEMLRERTNNPDNMVEVEGHRFLTQRNADRKSNNDVSFSMEEAVSSGIFWICQPKGRLGAEIFPQRVSMNNTQEAAQCKGLAHFETFISEIVRASQKRNLLVDISQLEEIAQGRAKKVLEDRDARAQSGPKGRG